MDSEAFRAWREGLGLSRREAATKLGVTEAAVWRWETGARAISRPVELATQAITINSKRTKRKAA